MEGTAEDRAAALTRRDVSHLDAEPFSQKDVWPPRSICVRHHADNLKAESTIERQRVTSPAAYLAECLRERRVEIDFAERCLSGEVVTARPKRERAAGDEQGFEIQDQGTAHTSATLCLVDDDRVQLPDQTVVFSDRADPAE